MAEAFAPGAPDVGARTMRPHLVDHRSAPSVLHQLPVAIWIKDPDGRYLGCNPKFEELFGKPEAELVGLTDADLVGEECAMPFREQDLLALADDEPVTTVQRVVADDGREIIWETTKTKVLDVVGDVVGVLGIGYDITEREQRHVEYVERSNTLEAFYRLVDRASDAVVLIDTSTGAVVEANHKAVASLRGSREELRTRYVWDLVEQISRRWWLDVARLVATPPEAPIRYDLVRLDGTTYPADVTIEFVEEAGRDYVIAVGRDVSDRLERERLTAQNAEQFAALTSGTRDGFLLVGPDGTILDANDAFCEIGGYAPDEVIGHPVTEFDVHDTLDDVAEHMARAVATGSEVFESVQRRKDGSTWPVQVSVTHTSAAGGRFFAFLRDLSEREDQHRALQRSADRWATLLDATTDGFARISPNGEIREVNRALCELVGRSEDELIGSSVFDIDSELTEPEARRAIADLETRRNRELVTVLRRDDGGECPTEIPVEIRATYSEVQGGQVFGFVRDISERLELTEQIERSAATFEAVKAGSRDGFLVVGADGRILDANDRYVELSGYSRDELCGLTANILDAIETPDEVAERLDGVGRTGAAIFESWHRRKDGSVWPVEVSTTKADVDGGQYLTFVRDITDRREAERRTLAAAQRYETLMAGTVDGFARIDRDGTILEVNDRLLELLGRSSAELVGRSAIEIDALNEADHLADEIDRAQAAGSGILTTEAVRPDGTTFPVEVNLTFSVAEGGQVLAFIRDITQRVEAEHEIREASQRYDALVTGTQDGFCLIDLEGRIVEFNEEFRRMSGYSADELSRMNSAELRSQERPGSVQEILERVRDVGSSVVEGHLRRRDGSLLPTEVSLTYADVEGGRVFAFVRDVSERREAERRIEFLAYNDVLTGLPNRERFSQQLDAAIADADADGTMVAVGYLDLDGFKPINDRFGHEAGDVLLVQLGQRLRRSIRVTDQVARFGGDEFVLLVRGLASLDQAREEAERIVELVKEPFAVEGHTIRLSASIGITVYPDDGDDRDALLRHADQAMYRAKAAGRNTYAIYDPVEHSDLRRRRAAVSEFESAIRREELVLHYQPRIELATGRVVGVEALVRWQHPARGLLFPASFLPMIEAGPLEFALDDWVLTRALRQLAAWADQGMDLSVSVNLSPRHIAQPGFPDALGRLLAPYPAELAQRLELEVLETSAVGRVSEVADVMRRCIELGVSFSLDDFGTGYSSLTYFHSLPVTTLKIDQSFVRGLLSDGRDLDIVEGVVQLAQALERPVVAEGVESIEVGMMLHRLGCRYAQGFGIARPMDAAAVPAWIERFRHDEDWTRFGAVPDDASGFHDLEVARAVHGRWFDAVVAYARSGGATRMPSTSIDLCALHHWYEGTGRDRYGRFECYPRIAPSHQRLHDLGRGLVVNSEHDDPASRLDIDDFEQAARDFEADIACLIEAASSADPGCCARSGTGC